MRLLELVIASVAVSYSGVAAFKDAAPLFVQNLEKDLTYVTKQDRVPICSILDTKATNILFQIPGLSNQDLVNANDLVKLTSMVKGEDFKYTPFYKYDKDSSAEISCPGLDFEVFEMESYETRLDKVEGATILKYPTLSMNEAQRRFELQQFDEQLSAIHKKGLNLIVQGIPVTNSLGSKILNSVENLLHPIKKREDLSDDEASQEATIEEIEAEIAETFKEIEDMIAEEGDSAVVIYDGDEASTSASNSTGTGLLEHYQFFSPGIWMTTVVSFMLLSILIIAFQWLNTLNISYKSFEKQVDAQKKTQ